MGNSVQKVFFFEENLGINILAKTKSSENAPCSPPLSMLWVGLNACNCPSWNSSSIRGQGVEIENFSLYSIDSLALTTLDKAPRISGDDREKDWSQKCLVTSIVSKTQAESLSGFIALLIGLAVTKSLKIADFGFIFFAEMHDPVFLRSVHTG